MEVYEELEKCIGFDWDEGNQGQNWQNHQLSDSGYEEFFFNQPWVASIDVKHSTHENRYYSLGQTDTGRQLFRVLRYGAN